MVEQVRSVDLLRNESGIEVMGIDVNGYLFRGTTIKVILFDKSKIIEMYVEGNTFYGSVTGTFKKRIIINKLIYFDQEVFDKLLILSKQQELAIEQSTNAAKRVKSAVDEIKSIVEIEAMKYLPEHESRRIFRSILKR